MRLSLEVLGELKRPRLAATQKSHPAAATHGEWGKYHFLPTKIDLLKKKSHHLNMFLQKKTHKPPFGCGECHWVKKKTSLDFGSQAVVSGLGRTCGSWRVRLDRHYQLDPWYLGGIHHIQGWLYVGWFALQILTPQNWCHFQDLNTPLRHTGSLVQTKPLHWRVPKGILRAEEIRLFYMKVWGFRGFVSNAKNGEKFRCHVNFQGCIII